MISDVITSFAGRSLRPGRNARAGVHGGPAPTRRRAAALLGWVLCMPAPSLLAPPAGAAPVDAEAGAVLLVQNTRPAPVERLRRIPERAREGVMLPPHGRYVTIDEHRFSLSPGAVIRDLNNRIVLPSHVRAPAKVRYTVDRNRQVSQIWIVANER